MARGIRWPEEEEATLKSLWAQHGGRITKVANAMGKSRGSISGKAMRMHLHFPTRAPRETKASIRAAALGRTVFLRNIEAPRPGILKDGENQRKLGHRVRKGAWKGFPLFSLTLEERRTCPKTCAVWSTCYGNQMGHAKRYAADADLYGSIYFDLQRLQDKHPRGFVVRLHILGDFMSEAYVRFWDAMLDEFPALHIFGYTARDPSDPVGKIIADIRARRWDRFAIRTSGAASGPRTFVIDAAPAPAGTIICPAQTGATACCATCGLCWAASAKERPVAFLAH